MEIKSTKDSEWGQHVGRMVQVLRFDYLDKPPVLERYGTLKSVSEYKLTITLSNGIDMEAFKGECSLVVSI